MKLMYIDGEFKSETVRELFYKKNVEIKCEIDYTNNAI